MSSVVKYDRTLFEPEHDLFRESYRAFLDKHVAPFHDQWEKDKIVDRGVWLEAGKQGFLGMAVPEEYGGGGNDDFRYNTIVCEETVAGRYSGIGFSLEAGHCFTSKDIHEFPGRSPIRSVARLLLMGPHDAEPGRKWQYGKFDGCIPGKSNDTKSIPANRCAMGKQSENVYGICEYFACI